MSKLSLSCDFCGKPISVWPSRVKTHNFCNGRDCYHLFRVERANKNRDAIKVPPKAPTLPPELRHNNPKLTSDQIEEGKLLLAEGNSQRFVATHFGVSRHVVKMHCKPGYREWYAKNYKTKEYTSRFTRNKEADREALKERRKLIKSLKPEEYKEFVKNRNNYNRDLIRKSYLKKHEGKYLK